MANLMRGEVEFEAGGKKRLFRLNLNDLISIQQEMGFEPGKQDHEFLEHLNNLSSLHDIRLIMRTGLHAADEEVDDEKAGELITELGLHPAIDLVLGALRWIFPDPDAKDAGDKGKAPKRRSPGKRTSSRRPAPA